MTAKNNPGSRPSETAFFTALRRALLYQTYHHDRFGVDNLAEIFMPGQYRFLLRFKKIVQNGLRKLNAAMPGMNEYLIARTALLDRIFVNALESGIPQIVILGAGYDTRAFRFANRNTCSTIFELDAPATQDRKKQCLKSARIQLPQRLNLIPINFQEECIAEVLRQGGFDLYQPALFLWEGVSYYLDAQSVDKVLAFVRCVPGSAIAFDYTIPLTAENLQHSYGSAVFLEAMRSYHHDEALVFSIADGEIDAYLQQRGLQVTAHYDPSVIELTFLLDPHGALIGIVTGNFRFVEAKSLNGY